MLYEEGEPNAGENAYVHGWHTVTKSVYHKLLQELRLEDQETIRKWIRLGKHEYHELLQLMTPLIMKEDTEMLKAVVSLRPSSGEE